MATLKEIMEMDEEKFNTEMAPVVTAWKELEIDINRLDLSKDIPIRKYDGDYGRKYLKYVYFFTDTKEYYGIPVSAHGQIMNLFRSGAKVVIVKKQNPSDVAKETFYTVEKVK